MPQPSTNSQNAGTVWSELTDRDNFVAAEFLKRVNENAAEYLKRCTRAHFLLIAIAIGQWFLVSGEVKQLTIMSQTIDRIETLVWLLPLAMAICVYQGFAFMILANSCRALTEEHIRRSLPHVYDANLEVFLHAPSLEGYERFSHYFLKGGKFFSYLAVLGFIMFYFVLPIASVVAALCGAYIRLPPSGLSYLQAALLALTTLLLVRTAIGIGTFLISANAPDHFRSLS